MSLLIIEKPPEVTNDWLKAATCNQATHHDKNTAKIKKIKHMASFAVRQYHDYWKDF